MDQHLVEHAHLDRLLNRPEVLGVEAVDQLLEREDRRLLVIPRLEQRPAQLHDLAGRAWGERVERPLDGGEGQAFALQIEDQADPVEVLLGVETRPSTHVGGRKQASGLVGADVASAHPGRLREGVDGHA